MSTSRIAAPVVQLAEWLQGTDIGLLELRGPGQTVRLSRQPSGEVREIAAPAPMSQASATATLVRAGSVGVVLLTHPLRSDPLVQAGQQVAAGQTLALLQIGLVLLAVPAPHAGVVGRIVCPHQSAVGFGAPLLELLA